MSRDSRTEFPHGHLGKIFSEGAVRVFGWALYSDHYRSSCPMLHWLIWGGDAMWEGYRLSSEERSLGSSSSCLESIKALSVTSRRQYGWDPFGMQELSTVSSFWKVYKQTVLGVCFHFLVVVIWL